MLHFWPISPLFLALIFAHLLADFVFQTDSMVANKDRWKSQLLHAFSVALLSYLFIGHLAAWPLALVVGAVHLSIDRKKPLWSCLSGSDVKAFWIDQLAHLISILVLCVISDFLIGNSDLIWWDYLKTFYLIGGLLLVVLGGSPFIKLHTDPFRKRLGEIAGDEPVQGLEQAGKTIGYLKRFLIFILVVGGNVAGVAFLIAAKSIFRFGELKDADNRHQAEYITIGTLASFSWALR